MNPNVHQRPSRTEAEAAVRAIIRWTAEDPDRDGQTSARVTRSFEEFFSDTARTRPRFWQRPFEEFEGYDEMIVLRDIRFESRCEHHMAPDHRSGLGRLRPKWPLGRHFQAGSSSRHLRQALADSREDDGADRQHHQRRAQAAGRWRDYQGNASLHDHPRRAQVVPIYHQPDAGVLPRQCADPPGVPRHGRLMQM